MRRQLSNANSFISLWNLSLFEPPQLPPRCGQRSCCTKHKHQTQAFRRAQTPLENGRRTPWRPPPRAPRRRAARAPHARPTSAHRACRAVQQCWPPPLAVAENDRIGTTVCAPPTRLCSRLRGGRTGGVGCGCGENPGTGGGWGGARWRLCGGNRLWLCV